jgi:hypothetical protein
MLAKQKKRMLTCATTNVLMLQHVVKLPRKKKEGPHVVDAVVCTYASRVLLSTRVGEQV